MEVSTATGLFASLACCCLLLGMEKKGPRPLPILGNLLQLGTKDVSKSFMELSKKYGSVFMIHLGSKPSVTLSGYQAVKEALVDQGVVFSQGEKWKARRRFAMHTLRECIEERTREEAQFLVKEFEKTQGTAFPFQFMENRAYEDGKQMPYTEAVIHEILRFIDVIPLGIPHSVTKDTHFRGYMLPKDPAQFKNPDQFDPNNVLDEKGQFLQHNTLMAFSAGKRYCLGETLACMELFVFFTTLLQPFTFKLRSRLT